MILVFIDMLDPSLAAKQAPRYEIRARKRGRPTENPPCLLDLSLSDIADFLDPAPDKKWEIRFFGPKAQPTKALDWGTFLRMKIARANRHGTKAAVWTIQQETKKGSRAQIFRDYKACGEFLERLEVLLEESG